jgi:hypothetical protein
MLTDIEVNFDINDNEKNVAPLAFIIEEDVLYTMATSSTGASLFLNYTDSLDVSEDFPENQGLTIKFLDNGLDLQILNTSEYFGSILLSNPKVVNLLNHKRGYATGEPAKFINNEFYVLDGRDNDNLADWPEYNIRENGYQCEGVLCGCKK